MSLPERRHAAERKARRLWAVLAVGGLMAVAGCTVRPLYSSSTVAPGGVSANAALASVAVNPVKTRYAQEVRNQLIFLFGGGNGQPASPEYTLDLGVTGLNEVSSIVQVTSANEPTAGSMTLTSDYVLTEVATGKRVAAARRQISAQYDIPRQEFATLRAQRDAENRAARELAELVRLAVAGDLARLAGQ